MSCHVYVDFDGTIVPCDATDFLFDRFALPEWHAVEEEWQAGRIGSRECMARQADMLRASPQDIEAAIAEIDIDPGFAGFVEYCRDNGIGATIVSDGFDHVIEAVMRRHGIDIPFFANHLEWIGGDRWRLSFPHAREDCVALAGHCKCVQAAAAGQALKVVIGDGRSDFCIAGKADLVLAKAKLLELCRGNGKPHVPFDSFFEVTAQLDGWLASRAVSDLSRRADAKAAGPSARPGAAAKRSKIRVV